MCDETFDMDILVTDDNPLDDDFNSAEENESCCDCSDECDEDCDCDCHFDDENDGQPTLYEEMQDYMGGDDNYDYIGDIDSYGSDDW